MTQKYEPVAASGLDESFIATATAVGSPTAIAQPYLEVVAPATLPEGYTFDAEANGQSFSVTVPMGGVEEGQKFPVPIPVGANVYANHSSVPIGHWKDDLMACCGLGCCHPTIWMAYCCPMILLGQVMHRLKLTWSGREADNAAESGSTFRIMFWFGVFWITLRLFQYVLPMALADENGELDENASMISFVFNVLLMSIFVFYLLIMCKVRRYIRGKYQIPEQQCHGCEDCCCVYWCSCCTLAQMARHTGDYAGHGARCCSETGLAPSAPSIV